MTAGGEIAYPAPMFAALQSHDVVILAGVILLNFPFVVPAISRCYFPNTKFGKWVDNTPPIFQVLIYWAVGGILIWAGLDERARYLKEHPPFTPGR